MAFFDYALPPELIAQYPCAERDAARLLVVDRDRQSLRHQIFRELPELLRPGDLLILNDSRVLPARLLGRRRDTGGQWEGLFLRRLEDASWEVLGKTRGRLREGVVIEVTPGPLTLELIQSLPQGHWQVRPNPPADPVELLAKHGHVPLPPYIRQGRADVSDRERYQTIYARHAGSVAAPTAGLHFTPRLLDELKQRGIEFAAVTLHVSLGTFQPVQTEDYRQHVMHAEWGDLPAATADAITRCRTRGGRVVAVGTTSVRVLETAAQVQPLRPWRGETNLFIHPPYEFRVVDALLTNFHLPRSTLLLLVGAFAGDELMRRAYETAVAERYRFFSYGDAMLIA